MSKLVGAGLARVFKSRLFWLCLAVAVLISTCSAWNVYRQYTALNGALETSAEDTIFQIVPYMIFLCAVFAGLFIGTEYGDGTLRNKLIVGHRRTGVYLANLLVTALAACVMLLAALGAGAAVGVPTLGLSTDALSLLYVCACSVFVCVALSAFCVLIAMSAGNRAVGVVLCIFLSLALLVGGSFLEGRLSEPEMVDDYIVVGEYGKPTQVEQHSNPLYVSGARREVLQLLCDALPTGQAVQISNREMERPERYIPLSLAFAALCTLGGVSVFKRKDLL